MLLIGTLLTVLDSIAASVDALSDVAAEIRTAADANLATLAAGDVSVKTEVVPVFQYRTNLIAPESMINVLHGAMVQRALDRHYGAEGGGDLNAFLETNDARVHPNLNRIGMQIDSRNVFAPTAVDPVASYEGSGAGSGTLSDATAIDTSRYGDSAFEIVVDSMGVDDRIVAVTVRNYENVETVDEITIPGASAPDDTIPILTRGVAIAAIETLSGGQAGDAFHVRSIVERELAL